MIVWRDSRCEANCTDHEVTEDEADGATILKRTCRSEEKTSTDDTADTIEDS